jgi:TonB family protein
LTVLRMENVIGQSTLPNETTPGDLSLHTERAATLTRLGILEHKAGRVAEAERLFTEAIDVGDTYLGRDHPSQAVALNELSRLLVRHSEHARAEPVLARLLEIARGKGERHPDVATALAGLAAAKHGLGDDAAAEDLYRQALAIREEVLPPNHMAIVITMEQLSDICAARGNLAEALSLLQRSLPRRECAVGSEHATVIAGRARKVELARLMFEARLAELRRSAVPLTNIVPIGATLTEPAPKAPTAPVAAVEPEPVPEPAEVAPPEHMVAPELSARPARRRRRKARFAAASGSVVVALMAVAGFTLGSHNRTVSGDVPTVTSSEARMALVGSASDARTRVWERANGARAGFPAATPKVKVSETPSVEAKTLTLPSIRRLAMPKIAMPNPDSVIQISPAAARDVDLVSTGVAPLSAAARSDEPSIIPPALIGSAPTPRYPDGLRAQKVEGEVVVRFKVDEKGRVDQSSMQVVHSAHAQLTAAVRNVLPGFRFEPARSTARDAKPQAAWVQFRTQFTAGN